MIITRTSRVIDALQDSGAADGNAFAQAIADAAAGRPWFDDGMDDGESYSDLLGDFSSFRAG